MTILSVAAPLGGIGGSLAAAIVAAAAWAVLFGVFAFANRPRVPRAGKEALDLPGDEAPAVVSMLTNGWRVAREALPATLLDLVARGYLKMDAANALNIVIRIPDRSASHADLTPFEEQVFDLVRSEAVNGLVPAAAVTTGSEGRSVSWWLRFRGRVMDDARRRGLSRPRWSSRVVTALSVTGLAPALLFGRADAGPGGHFSYGTFLGVWLPLIIFTTSLRSAPVSATLAAIAVERETLEGSEAASRWLGVRVHLAKDRRFATLPPTAVATWERLLAYGVAMRVAPGAEAGLPLGGDSDRDVWSSYGGTWRRIRIRWPTPLQMPGHSRVMGFFSGVYLAGMGLLAGSLTLIPIKVIGFLSEENHQPAGAGGTALLAVALLGLIVLIAVGLGLMWFGLRKLGLTIAPGEKIHVQGMVLRVHSDTGLIAVDDGKRRRGGRGRASSGEPILR